MDIETRTAIDKALKSADYDTISELMRDSETISIIANILAKATKDMEEITEKRLPLRIEEMKLATAIYVYMEVFKTNRYK